MTAGSDDTPSDDDLDPKGTNPNDNRSQNHGSNQNDSNHGDRHHVGSNSDHLNSGDSNNGDSVGHDSNDGDRSGHAELSDDSLERALEGFEREFRNDPDETELTGSTGPMGSTDDGDQFDQSAQAGGFDDELQGLLGNRAKVAVMITRLASAELLAAFCQLTDIAADCIAGSQGAVALLRNLDADAPEAAAKDLTTVVSGLAVVLVVNRADKLEATMYIQGEAGQTFVPPVLFASTASFVEDLMLGISSLDDIKSGGVHVVDSASYDRDQAMQVIARHTRTGRGSEHE